ncbi:MAG TPA: hypothetical protein VJP45_07720 [Candidatus Limnocylindria bacterium]|nr:hypothetical protein [Candidatus Limnocylindria bacterium]
MGYERIRGLREIGQRLDGAYEASKSRTFAVSATKLFDAFAKPRLRARWLPGSELRSASPRKRLRLRLSDGTSAEVGFIAKTASKSAVAIQHQRLPNKTTAAKMKTWWSERLDALGEVLGV